MGSIKSVLRPIWNSPFIWKVRGIFFDISESITGYRRERRVFLEKMGYKLDLKNPRSFSEHIVWKKIYDRNPILPMLADKFRVREYVKRILGKEAEDILIPLLFSTVNPETIPFDKLSGEYIIKSNHNSGPHFIVQKGEIPNKKMIVEGLKKQLKYDYGILKHEWAYKKIKKKMVVIERLLRDEGGQLPKDYKLHMIKGECAFIQVDFDRFIDHSRTLYDEDWNFLPVTLKFKQGRDEPRPKNLEKMLYIARRLSEYFDYIRIDLYSIGSRVYLGEMTHYPGSGMERFTPESYDFDLGKYWQKSNEDKRNDK